MALQVAGVALACLILGGCNNLTVREATLSNNQKVAMVSTPGDGVSPPTNLVLVETRKGQFAPVSTGYGSARCPLRWQARSLVRLWVAA